MREEILSEIREMVKQLEHLPQYIMDQPLTNRDLYSILLLMVKITQLNHPEHPEKPF